MFYRQVGLGRTLKDAFCIKSFQYYADTLTGLSRADFGVHAGIDFSGKGGNFIVDSTGKLLYAHLQRNQFDRPDVGTLIEFLQQLV